VQVPFFRIICSLCSFQLLKDPARMTFFASLYPERENVTGTVIYKTEFKVPGSFLTFSTALGSCIHSPSAINLYSYRPGGKSARNSQPSATLFILMACSFHPLKLPARMTSFRLVYPFSENRTAPSGF